MVYTTHLWWLGEWFIIAIPTLVDHLQEKKESPTVFVDLVTPGSKKNALENGHAI